MKKIIILFFLLSIVYATRAQDENQHKKHYFSLVSNYGSGTILPTTDFVKGNNRDGLPIENFRYMTLKALWQNPGYQNWQRIHKHPYYGFGISISDFHKPQEIGKPISYFGILGLPVFRFKKSALYTEMQFGLSHRWKIYNARTNPFNDVIGGNINFHANLGLNALFQIYKNLDLGTGLAFIHFSNGGIERPNRGFNIYSPFVELKYHFGSRPETRKIAPPDETSYSTDLYVMLTYGIHQLVEHQFDTTNYYSICGISAMHSSQVSDGMRIKKGIDLNYWAGLNANEDGTPGPYSAENYTLGIIIQPEIILNKVTLVGGIGTYIIHKDLPNFRALYQRLGVQYTLFNNFSIGLNVRSRKFKKAEFMEFNFGYSFKVEGKK